MQRLLIPLLSVAVALVGCAAAFNPPAPPRSIANEVTLGIPFKVISPDGPGPFPAVVILHDCSGLGPASSGAPARWAKELVARGYLVIIPDSFTSRGFAEGVCTNPSPARAEVSPARRVRDAYATLAYVRSLPNVAGARIGVMGGSHGGATTLATMVSTAGVDRRDGFAAAVALYPSCALRMGEWRADGSGIYKPLAPLLILSGELDDWTPAEPCRKLAEAAQRAGYPVSIKIYPGAHHSFDNARPVRYVANRVNGNAPGGRGATTGGNAHAWSDSIEQVIAFFDKNMGKAR
jgi:dienelactone hydrolase